MLNTDEKITGRNIVLRPISERDTENIVKWKNNPRVKHNYRYKNDITAQIHEEWLKSKVYNGFVKQYIIEDKVKGIDVGSVFLRDIDNIHKSAEFGIFIGEDEACGKGFGYEATKLLTNYGLNALKLRTIYLRVFEDNTPAIRCYNRAGYKLNHEEIEMIEEPSGIQRKMIHMEINLNI